MAIITISRASLSGGATFAACLAAELGYRVLAREDVVETAERAGVSEKVLLQHLEGGAAWPETASGERRNFLRTFQSILANACLAGNLVYYGHTEHLLLKNWPGILKIQVMAPVATRVRAVMEWRGLDYQSAQEYIHRIDRQRRRLTTFLYGTTWRDFSNYDLVFNLRDMSMESACALAVLAARLPAYQVNETTRKTFHYLAFTCRLELARTLAQTDLRSARHG